MSPKAAPQVVMTPHTDHRCLRYVGDTLRITFRLVDESPLPADWEIRLRTTLGRAEAIRREVIEGHTDMPLLPGAAWHDIKMTRQQGHAELELFLTEVGFFRAKAYAIDQSGRQYWPAGSDLGISVHPNAYRTANIIYSAFIRLFGRTKQQTQAVDPDSKAMLKQWEDQGYSVIPPSGTLRDLKHRLPHIFERLGCRILHLLPINPTPTTYARMGRFGSPYAGLNMTAIDPALVEFDRVTTGLDQFAELVYEVHRYSGRIFLDLVINHTGWGSELQENHPDWFLRDAEGRFLSPGAWDTVWHDLVALDHTLKRPAEYLATVFLTWCRRGVDGFRCDAGYKIPLPVWRYIIARVRSRFPDTVFLLEGLGGSWEATEALLTEGGMQWAYSELFQNYSGPEITGYLDYSLNQSRRIGTYLHYSETHDNNRLAANGCNWALMRNRLCALTSTSGGFGYTCGVEWLATEKINVHQCTGLAWDNPDNLVAPLSRLAHLLADHPCFFDDASCERLTPSDSPTYALKRTSGDAQDVLLVVINPSTTQTRTTSIEDPCVEALGDHPVDLLDPDQSMTLHRKRKSASLTLGPGQAYCLAPHRHPIGMRGEAYREQTALAAWAVQAIHRFIPLESIAPCPRHELADRLRSQPDRFLGILPSLSPQETSQDLVRALNHALDETPYPRVVCWTRSCVSRITPVPPDHWLLIQDESPFRISLDPAPNGVFPTQESLRIGNTHYAAFYFPKKTDSEIKPGHPKSKDLVSPARPTHRALEPIDSPDCPINLHLTRYAHEKPKSVVAELQPLAEEPGYLGRFARHELKAASSLKAPFALLTNGRGGMTRMAADLGHIKSKYDCLLAANLHPKVPVDRHVFVKRLRAWAIADGMVTPLNLTHLASFSPGPPAEWHFVPSLGDGRCVGIRLQADVLQDANTVVISFLRSEEECGAGIPLSSETPLRLTVRLDIEDRSFHAETHHTPEADRHFRNHCTRLPDGSGFRFAPARDRFFRAYAAEGNFHDEREWCDAIPHPVEASRGQVPSGDAFSLGWFDLPLGPGNPNYLVVTAEEFDPDPETVRTFAAKRQSRLQHIATQSGRDASDSFGQQLSRATDAFLARRDQGMTVIAGYPWFLDWGRDTFICARGLVAGGWIETVKDILKLFGGYEQQGTLPNSIHATDLSNRNTSDAPLWYGVVCRELLDRTTDPDFLNHTASDNRRSIAQVLRDIAIGYLNGTPNGIRTDPASGLAFSPTHFTWMDTNYPAGTPREGYPIEIQVLWIQLLQTLADHKIEPAGEPWEQIAGRAQQALIDRFWLEPHGYLADVLFAPSGRPAAYAQPDNALRCNFLFALSFGLVTGPMARRAVTQALHYLVVPGAIRSIAPLPVSPPLPIHAADGGLLNDPHHPYWGRYEGDEDSRRKPAYHNGTAWTWPFPTFVEALVRAYDMSPHAIHAGKAYLGSMAPLLNTGCLGHLPEILDGDTPHTQRGCDAQAWGATEALRLWKWLQQMPSSQEGSREHGPQEAKAEKLTF